MSELPVELRDRAARAAFDAQAEVIGFNDGRDLGRDFKVQIVAWRAVVDAVAGVLAEHQAEAGETDDDTPFPWELHLKAAHIALREVSKHAEAETKRADEADEVRRAQCDMKDREVLALRSTLRNVGKALDKQRKRRKAAEANYRHVREQLHGRTVELDTVKDERDALKARAAHLADGLETAYSALRYAIVRRDDERTDLGQYARQIRDALDADRAAVRAEEGK